MREYLVNIQPSLTEGTLPAKGYPFEQVIFSDSVADVFNRRKEW